MTTSAPTSDTPDPARPRRHAAARAPECARAPAPEGPGRRGRRGADGRRAPPGHEERRSAGAAPRRPAADGRDPADSQHSPRFQFLLGALLGVAVGAIGATLVLASGEGPSTGPGAWSQWQPATSPGDGPSRSPTTSLARTASRAATARGRTAAPEGRGVPRPLPANSAVATQDTTKIGIIRTTALYRLCGLGSRCSIGRGKPSAQRACCCAARRSSWRCTRSATSASPVVALLPPAPGQRPQNAVFFQRSEFKKVLDHPIDQVLPSPPPSIVGLTDTPQGKLMSTVTAPSVYCFSFQQAQDLSAFLVLQKPAANAKQPCAAALTTGSATPQPTTSGSSGTTSNG